MLRRQGPQEWIHEEIKNVNAIEFQYKDEESPLYYVMNLTSRMIQYTLKDVLTAGYLIEEWKPELITELLSYFRPDNMRVTVISKTFQDQTNAEDKYYGTPFTLSKIPVETINFWLEDDICNDFKMPLKNKYIAHKFNLLPIENNEPEIPQIFYDSAILRCWLKKDTEFRLPKAYVSVKFFR
ncbi:insulin-degrading enzyme-like [Rhopalosiphum padi]|uniref:insulin-degrading enzyme-like n=1 Tax=Rhopalosiphum padi TaxID=40932 RepID=UPI00298D74DA|nr:insulin-degrading enzyme-like [Rhopalosiphum padi]